APHGMESPRLVRQRRTKRLTTIDGQIAAAPGEQRTDVRPERGSRRRRIRPRHSAADVHEFSSEKMIQSQLLVDSHGRTMRDLRVSITDRCNFRCLYCLPETEAAQNFYRGHWAHLPDSTPIVQQWVPKSNILSFEEIERVIRVAVGFGIRKVRLTGGE